MIPYTILVTGNIFSETFLVATSSNVKAKNYFVSLIRRGFNNGGEWKRMKKAARESWNWTRFHKHVMWTSRVRADEVLDRRHIDFPTYVEVVAHIEIVEWIRPNNLLYRTIRIQFLKRGTKIELLVYSSSWKYFRRSCHINFIILSFIIIPIHLLLLFVSI